MYWGLAFGGQERTQEVKVSMSFRLQTARCLSGHFPAPGHLGVHVRSSAECKPVSEEQATNIYYTHFITHIPFFKKISFSISISISLFLFFLLLLHIPYIFTSTFLSISKYRIRSRTKIKFILLFYVFVLHMYLDLLLFI